MSAVVLLSALLALFLVGRAVVGGLLVCMRRALRDATGVFHGPLALAAGARAALEALAFPVGAIFFSALLINLLQTRGLFVGTILSRPSTRLVPRPRRLFCTDGVVLAGTGLLKVAVLALISATAFVVVAPGLIGLCGSPPPRVLEGILAAAKAFVAALTLAMLALGLADYLWQLRRYSKSLRMSADEVKREHKESEGEPRFKHERKRIHLELTQGFAKLTEADVVVVAPHAGAVALRFAPDLVPAPLVLRKARGAVASELESLAAHAGVPTVSNPDLVAALDDTEEGDEIPEGLYELVAELIADARFASGLAIRAEPPQTVSEVSDVH